MKVISTSKSLVKEVYLFCNNKLPQQEKFGLWSQMTRCAVSVPSNLAEGSQRGPKEFLQFVKIARGSLEELRIQLELCVEIGYCTNDETTHIITLIDSVGRMTAGLMKTLRGDKK